MHPYTTNTGGTPGAPYNPNFSSSANRPTAYTSPVGGQANPLPTTIPPLGLSSGGAPSSSIPASPYSYPPSQQMHVAVDQQALPSQPFPHGFRPPSSDASITNIPAYPVTFPELLKLSVYQLRNLKADPSAFDSFIESHSHTRLLREKMEIGVKQMEELESENQKIRDEIQRLSKTELGISIEEQLESEKQQYAESEKLYKDWLIRNSHSALAKRLEDMASGVNQESKELRQRFLDNQIPIEQFCEDYAALRQRYHLLMMKLELAKGLTGYGTRYSSQPSQAGNSSHPIRR